MVRSEPPRGASTPEGGFSAHLSGGLPGGGEHPEAVCLRGGLGEPDQRADGLTVVATPCKRRGSPSLGSSTVNGHGERPPHPCREDGLWATRVAGGPLFPLRCRRLSCARCLPREAAVRQLVLANSAPVRFMTVTLVADAGAQDPWQQARVRIKRMFEAYREITGYRIEYSVVVEKNPKGTGFHAHFLCDGDYIKQGSMQVAAVRAGAGSRKPDIRKIAWGADRAIAGYGLKGFRVAGYGLKSMVGPAAREALKINGGRLEHHSRGFIKIAGETCLLSTASARALEELRGPVDSGPMLLYRGSVRPFRVIENGKAYYPEEWAEQQPTANGFGWHPSFGRYIGGDSSVPVGNDGRGAQTI